MKKVKDYFRQGSVLELFVLVTGILLAAVVGIRLVGTAIIGASQASMYTTPHSQSVAVGDTFTLQVVVAATIPVNAFAGEVDFDPTMLAIAHIDYNTSIADLWAVQPWYSNGAGTVNFGGGSTRKGGFEGTGNLLTLTFKTLKAGNGNISLHHVQILQANGLGSGTTLAAPIDTLFTVTDPTVATSVFQTPSATSTSFVVQTKPPTPDLNGDGKYTIIDISIFMKDLIVQDKHADFNADGVVDGRDLSILMSHLQ